MMSKRRLEPDIRRDEILSAGLFCAEKYGWTRFTRIQVAECAKCAESLVSAYFGTMVKFRRDIMREAIRSERLKIIAQGLIAEDRHARKANPDLKRRALENLAL